MPDYKQLARGLNTAIRAAEAEASALQKMKGTQDVLPAAEREANKAKFLAESREPRRMYHSTGSEFRQFIPSGGSRAVFVTPDAKFAENFALDNFTGSKGSDKFQTGTRTMPVRVQVKNPFDYEKPEHIEHLKQMARKRFPGNQQVMDEIDALSVTEHNWPSVEHPDIQRLIKQGGYDSFYASERGTKNLGVYDPRKVKSDIGNRGTYDVTKGDINEAKGGLIHMQKGGKAGALGKIAEAINAANKEADAILAVKKAEEQSKPGVHYADPLKPATMRMSEALGNAGAEGKTLRFTEADRSRVFGSNRGGVGFSGLQHYSEPHKQANTVWGFGNKNTADKKVRQNDPETTIWTTFVGAPDQHKSNTVVLQDAIKEFHNAVKQGKVHPGQIKLMNDRIRAARDENTGAPLFDSAFDLTDPNALKAASTFNRRSAIGDVLMGEGVKGPMRSKAFKQQYGPQVWHDSGKMESVLRRETDPDLVNANTYDVGNRLFIMDNGVIERPDLNVAFPLQVTGTDLGLKYKLTPKELAMRDWMKQYEGRKDKKGRPSPVSYMDLARNNPSQFVSEDFLSFLQKQGHKDGGKIEVIRPFSDEKAARKWKDEIATEMNKANGGEIKKLAWRDTKPMRMAQGGQPSLGPVTDNTMPDSSDSGQIKYAPKFSGGGAASPEEMLTPPTDSEKGKARLMMEILARMAKDQGSKEIASLKKPRAATDVLNKGLVASTVGAPVDIMNMGLEGIDAIRDLASGKRVENRLASDKPFLGSEHLKGLMKQYGMVTDEERPMLETATSILSPGAAVKGAAGAAQAAPKAARAVEGGLNAATAAVARPFTPATVTMEAVAPDLAKFKPRQWQETATRRMTGPGAPVSMETMGGRQTTKRPAQGVYLNDPDEFGIRQLETNPMVAVDVPRAGNLSTNKPLRKDVSQAGMELSQESVAAHRFLPMATQNIADASSMLIKPKKGAITSEEVAALGRELPHMIVAHNPRLGGVVIAPFQLKSGKVPTEFFDAQEVASRVLGDRAKFTYGKTDPDKDLMYIPRADYVKEGATAPSPASKAMRERLKKAEGRLFRQSVPATAETP